MNNEFIKIELNDTFDRSNLFIYTINNSKTCINIKYNKYSNYMNIEYEIKPLDDKYIFNNNVECKIYRNMLKSTFVNNYLTLKNLTNNKIDMINSFNSIKESMKTTVCELSLEKMDLTTNIYNKNYIQFRNFGFYNLQQEYQFCFIERFRYDKYSRLNVIRSMGIEIINTSNNELKGKL